MGILLLALGACIFVSDADLAALVDKDGDSVPVDDDCDDRDAGEGAATLWFADDDGDGWGAGDSVWACEAGGRVATSSDCNDGDASIHPDAAETCDGADQDCDGVTDEDATDAADWFVDADGDGHGAGAAALRSCVAVEGHSLVDDDCDDADATIHPDADEWCDGVDDDCDAETDEIDAVDATFWYRDADNDGQGGDDATLACDAPIGSVATTGDCDDNNPDARAGLDERCDGFDDDCDGEVDEADAIDALDWYLDRDGDEWGAGEPTPACAAPDGGTLAAGDCDDLDATAHPGGEEVCGGGDENCDGTTDEDGAVGASTWYSDADGDGFGLAGTAVDSCVAPAAHVANGDDCDDAAGDVNPGAAEICDDGVDQDCDGGAAACRLAGSIDSGDADGTYFGGDMSQFGVSIAGVGDIDEDGFDDLLIGAPEEDSTDEAAGYAHIVYGYTEGSDTFGDGTSGVLGAAAGDRFGERVAVAGDLDGDGHMDLVAAAPDAESDAGVVSILTGRGDRYGRTTAGLITTDLTGDAADDKAGTGLAGGVDGDGDGIADLLIGAPGAGDTGLRGGGVWIFRGGGIKAGALSTADTIVRGTTDEARMGTSVVWIGDADGDGVEDFATAGTTSVWVYSGDLAGDADESAASTTLTWATVDEPSLAAGDFDGDGAPDLVVGLALDTTMGLNAGAVHLVAGTTSGDLATEAFATFLGTRSPDMVGRAVAAPGDLDQDGHDDLLLGGPGYDDPTNTIAGAEGAMWLQYGAILGAWSVDDADARILGADAAGLGHAVAGAGDVNGDGFPDFAGGAPWDSTGGDYAGSVAIFLGSGR